MSGLEETERVKEKAQEQEEALNKLFDDVYGKTLPAGDNLVRTANETGQEKPKTNPDGSVVESARMPDGKTRPWKITYTDGHATAFTYGADGMITGFAQINPDRSIREAWTTTDGKTYREERTRRVIEGTPSVKDDGHSKFTFKDGNTVESRGDGKAIAVFKDAQGNPHKVLLSKDLSAVELGMAADGKEHPIRVRHPDSREETYKYDQSGKIVEVAQYGPGGEAGGVRLLHWICKDGKTWKESSGKFADFTGSAEMKEDGTYVFKQANTGMSLYRYPNGYEVWEDKDGNVPGTKQPARPWVKR